MKTHHYKLPHIVVLSLTLIVTVSISSTGNAEEDLVQAQDSIPVLDADQQLASPIHKSEFLKKMLPLDATLSWTERFSGNEMFNDKERLNEDAVIDEASMQPQTSSSTAKSVSQWDATGTIKSLRLSQNKVKIKHGPIDRLGMPQMTMMFGVSDPQILSQLKNNEEVGFNVEVTSAGYMVSNIAALTKSTPLPAATESKPVMDGRGIVKTIRINQGKLKIKHGPIDRLGMPAMTMMFSVKDPALLQGLTKDTEIEFSVDNTAGGFMITNIKRVQ